MMKYLFYSLLLSIVCLSCQRKDATLFTIASSSKPTTIYVSEKCDSLIYWAINDVAQSIENITGTKFIIEKINQFPKTKTDGSAIFIGLYSDALLNNSKIIEEDIWKDVTEQFLIKQHKSILFVIGSDIRGTVYGIFDMAKRSGISPWNWWADVQPLPKDMVMLNVPHDGILQAPSVKFRGIFLNDEDWGLQPWAANTFEPETGDIGPKTYEKVFQLLLRLKANTIWPAMHPCTKPFFEIDGNKEMAKKYHIVLGSSHAEPMLKNNVREWDKQKNGDFNYFNNSIQVQQYWKDRVTELKKSGNECQYTMGMRGIHDSKMEGASTQKEMVNMMQTIIEDQRKMLETTLEKPLDEIPQILVPYKEVLDIYNDGLQVPEDITLMWCDDNYGYIRRLSNEEEQQRKGGAGVYYHLSYWGRPHDYLWLSTTQPGLIWYEMTKAYQNGANKIWIANVGDIKPAEYNIEFFMDLAWDVQAVNTSNIKDYLKNYYSRDFGEKNALLISHLMDEYYRLAFLRKPEFMGWSQTEPSTPTGISDFNQFSNGNEVQRRIDSYGKLVSQVDEISTSIRNESQDAFFQLIEYPVKGAAYMNDKFMYAQLAYSAEYETEKKKNHEKAAKAYASIASITEKYNTRISEGKWKHMMDGQPRVLSAFQMPDYHLQIPKDSNLVTEDEECKPVFIQAKDFNPSLGTDTYAWKVIHGLGYSDAAITLYPFMHKYFKKDMPYVEYSFDLQKVGQYEIEIRCLPTHSNNLDHELWVSVDDKNNKSYKLNTKGRSTEWKENVLRNFKSVKYLVSIDKTGDHTLRLAVNQTGIVIDQIAINPVGHAFYYEIPR